jgi:peptidoglycan/xylan/chitin deacetylase (PgdA/CDA1 family)
MTEWKKIVSTRIPGPAMERYFRREKIEVLFPFYHSVSDRLLPHISNLYPIRSVSEFEADLEFLLQHFEPVSLTEFLEGRFVGKWKKTPMVISFDDGLIQCYEYVLPVLEKKGVPAVFFLNNAFIDNRAMFYRFKVSLLLEKFPHTSSAEREKAAEILKCSSSDTWERLRSVSYIEREFTDHIAEAWGYSFQEYMRLHPVYMSSIQIKKIIDRGHEIGSHGIDHPLFSVLKKETTLNHIQRSVKDLQKRYHIGYKYFAFPFTDFGVEDATIDQLFKQQIIDAGFGTAGMKEDLWPAYFQRIPMEMLGLDARRTLQGEINRRRVRKLFGRNMTKRK